MADKDTKNAPKNDTGTTNGPESEKDTTSIYDDRPEKDPTATSPDEEVTPHNAQAPVSDEDKLKQDNILTAQHVEQGYPANMIPRTAEERQRMRDEGLIQ